jgi:hypothetical protein
MSGSCAASRDLVPTLHMCRRRRPSPDASLMRCEWAAEGSDQWSDSPSQPLVFRAEHGRLPGALPQKFRQEQTRICVVTPMLRWDLHSYIWCFAFMLDRSARWKINFHISNHRKSAMSDVLPRI